MIEWSKIEKRYKGAVLGLGRNRQGLKELMVRRMTVAYDLAAAFFYLHENRYVAVEIIVTHCPIPR